MSKKQTKTREQELEEKKRYQEYFDAGVYVGIKKGEAIREDEIMKIIKRRIKFWTPTRYTLNVDPCRNKKVELEELEEEITKQKIKGDEK